jgi:aryl-alcohol dehydrogenase-like predicted oxidoreductase
MRTTPLGQTGVQVSALSLGCMQMGTIADDASSFALLDRYAEAGGTFLDTADCYSWWWAQGTDGGQSEDVIGRWMVERGNRDTTFVATKGTGRTDYAGAWPAGAPTADWDYARRHFVGAGAATLRESLEGSLRRLRTDHVDLYYVHVDDRATPLEETLGALAELVAEGKVRHIGWSNVRTWRLERIRQLAAQHGWPAPVAVQQAYSYLQRRAGLHHGSITDDEQLDYLTEHPDLTLVAYSPVLKGLYDLAPERRSSVEVYADFAGDAGEARLEAAREVADELGVLPSQVVLAWLYAHTPRVVPIIGTATVERLDQAIAALDLPLSDEQLKRLDAA